MLDSQVETPGIKSPPYHKRPTAHGRYPRWLRSVISTMDGPSKLDSAQSRGVYFPAFDYLRIGLATAVAATHAGLSPWEPSGNYAVQVFFALSGWLIGGILLNSEPRGLPKFYFHRAARIWLPYFVAIALLMAASLLKDRITWKWIEIFFYDTTFVYNFFGPPQLAQHAAEMPLAGTGNHFWSICAEEQFYLLAPFLITIAPFGRKLWFWIILAAIILASPYSDYFGSICLGVTAAVAAFYYPNWQLRTFSRLLIGFGAGALFACTVFVPDGYRFFAPSSAICIVLLFSSTGKATPIGVFLGGVSYPLYLNQWIGVFLIHGFFAHFGWRSQLAAGLLALFLSLAISTALYLLVDRTIKIHRDRFFTRQRGIMIAMIGFSLVICGVAGSFFFAE